MSLLLYDETSSRVVESREERVRRREEEEEVKERKSQTPSLVEKLQVSSFFDRGKEKALINSSFVVLLPVRIK